MDRLDIYPNLKSEKELLDWLKFNAEKFGLSPEALAASMVCAAYRVAVRGGSLF